MQTRRPHSLLALCSFLLSGLTLAACDHKREEELGRQLNETGDKLVACKKDEDDLKKQVSALKRQLAEAMANPNKIQLTDPEIINLIADLRQQKGLSADVKPSLDPKAASQIVMQGAKAMQACYERALKKNAALQMQAGLGLNLEITVKGTGSVDAVEVNPSVDREMTSCIKTAAMHWKFPSFQGEPVVLTQKVTLTPKT
jgi:hypothetical protein